MVNNDIYSREDELMAQYLKERNIKKANQIQKKVHPRTNVYSQYTKRILDAVISFLVIVVLLPVLLLLSLFVLKNMGHPIIFKQTRMGKSGKEFNVLKFRSMTNERDENGDLLPSSKRLTKFGLFIRKYSLDELPQFFNILKGDMSIIGPRPYPLFYFDRMSERHKGRLAVRPGLECPRIAKNINQDEGYQKEFENAVWYVENISFITDIRMVFRLAKMTLNIKNRSENAEGKGYFAGYDSNGNATSLKRFKREHPVEWKEICDS